MDKRIFLEFQIGENNTEQKYWNISFVIGGLVVQTQNKSIQD